MKKYSFYKNDPVESIVELIERSSRLYRESTAIKFKENRKVLEKSYNELLSDTKLCANNLLQNYPTANHIAVLGSSSYGWIVTYLGAVFAGRVIVPLDKELAAAELSEQITQADVELLVFDKEYADVAAVEDKAGVVNIMPEGRPEPPIGTRVACLLVVSASFICHAISVCPVRHIFCIQQKDLFSV